MATQKLKTCRARGCENKFTPSFSTLQAYCSSQCTYNEKKRKDSENPKSKPKTKRIPKKSEKRSKQEKVYSGKRIVFLMKPENKYCPVFPSKLTTEVHHKKGRIGSLLTDDRYWLAVSREGHQYIENNPKEAKLKGWSLSRLATTDG